MMIRFSLEGGDTVEGLLRAGRRPKVSLAPRRTRDARAAEVVPALATVHEEKRREPQSHALQTPLRRIG